MKLDIAEKDGWLYVVLGKPSDWKSPTFFPLVDAMFKQIQSAYQENERRIVFDLTMLDYIDSTVVSLFLQTARLTPNERGALIVSSEYVRDLIGLLGIDKLMDLYRTPEEWRAAQSQ